MSIDDTLAAHIDPERLDIHETVRRLNSHLGTTLVAALAGSRDSTAPSRWADPAALNPPDAARARLRTAHHVWLAIADSEGPNTARVWFQGLNPFLGDTSPVIALREGRARDVVLAAHAFLNGTWSA